MMAPIIETTSYRLRPFKDSDAELWQVWDIDPEVQAHMPEPMNEPWTLDEQRSYIKECEHEEDGYYWSIETNDGVTIGTIALADINTHHKITELGIVIGDKSYWGKGVATEVVTTLVQYAFLHLGVMRISAEAEVSNMGVQRVLEAAGFTRDGLFKSARVKNGIRIDVIHYGAINAQ